MPKRHVLIIKQEALFKEQVLIRQTEIEAIIEQQANQAEQEAISKQCQMEQETFRQTVETEQEAAQRKVQIEQKAS